MRILRKTVKKTLVGYGRTSRTSRTNSRSTCFCLLRARIGANRAQATRQRIPPNGIGASGRANSKPHLFSPSCNTSQRTSILALFTTMSLLGKKFPGLLGRSPSASWRPTDKFRETNSIHRQAHDPLLRCRYAPSRTRSLHLRISSREHRQTNPLPRSEFSARNASSDKFPPGAIVLYGVNSLQNALSNSE